MQILVEAVLEAEATLIQYVSIIVYYYYTYYYNYYNCVLLL